MDKLSSSASTLPSPTAAPAPSGFAKTFDAARNPHFRQLLIGSFGSFMGMSMSILARGYLAYDLTGSAAILGLVSLASGIPQLFLSPVAGVFADRFPKRNVLMVTQLMLAVLAFTNALLVQFHLIQVWHLALLAFFQGVVFAFNLPGRQSFVPLLVQGRAQLANATALNNGLNNLTRIAGPSLGGILIAVPGVGLTGVFYLIAACYAWAVYSIWRIPIRGESERGAHTSVAAEMTAGLRTIWNNPSLRLLIWVGFIPLLVGMPYVTLMPVFAASVLNVGSEGLGFLLTANGVGALAGSILIAFSSDRPNRRTYQLISGFVFGATLICFAFSQNFFLSLALLLVVGGCCNAFMVLNSTLIMLATPPAVYGRVMGVYMMSFALMPITALPIGAIVDALGPPLALALAGAITACASLGLAAGERRQAQRAAEAY